MIRVLQASIYSLTTLFSVQTADAGNILTPDRQSELCRQAEDDQRIIDPKRLAYAVVGEARIPFDLLDRANLEGEADGSITEDEIYHAVTEASENPFGPQPIPTPPVVAEAQEALQLTLLELQVVLSDGRTADRRFVVDRQATEGSGPTVDDLFKIPAGVRVICISADDAGSVDNDQQNGGFGRFISAVAQGLLIRGKVTELTRDRSKISSIDTADISFLRDEEANSSTFGIDGVLGYNVDLGPRWSVIPHLRYERRDTDSQSGSEDIELLSPGVLASYDYSGEYLSAALAVNPKYQFDLEQNSERLTLQAFAVPTLELGDGGPILFGGWQDITGPLEIRPNIVLLAEAADVVDAGDSQELAGVDSYFGLGGDASIKLRLDDIPVLSEFVVEAGYRHLEFIGGGIDEDSISKFSAGIFYSIPNNENIAIKFSYENGEDEETFQDEEFYKLSLGIRF